MSDLQTKVGCLDTDQFYRTMERRARVIGHVHRDLGLPVYNQTERFDETQAPT